MQQVNYPATEPGKQQQTEIDRRIERLSLCTQELIQRANRLRDRLDRALMPTGSGVHDSRAPSAPTPVMSPLGAQLDVLADGVVSANAVLDDIEQRLAL